MDTFNPGAVFSSIDHNGRYAYNKQPAIGCWNLMQLAQTLIPFLDNNRERAIKLAQDALDKYMNLLTESYQTGMMMKLGLRHNMRGDIKLTKDLLDIMAKDKMDYTLTFRYLSDLAGNDTKTNIGTLIICSEKFNYWLKIWKKRLAKSTQSPKKRQTEMYTLNPAFIPRNHLIEEAIKAAVENKDFNLFHQLIDVVKQPFEYQAALEKYARAPRPEQIVHETFCGT